MYNYTNSKNGLINSKSGLNLHLPQLQINRATGKTCGENAPAFSMRKSCLNSPHL
ncbi:MAG: hypothetical protein ACXWTQ_09990 [Methylococcaceae bacterium]